MPAGIFKAMSDLKDCRQADQIQVAPSPDQVIGNFRIEAVLGRGAMGNVYLARHTILDGKKVAVKMLHQHLCNEPSALKRFKQEAESASTLRHDGIVTVQDFGITDDGQPYLVMDLIDGVSLSDVLSEGPMAPARALKLASQICDALKVAHDHGVVHRDIKPSNLMLTNAGTDQEAIKVVDFGIAKFLEESKAGALTQTGEAMGSPPYMSPEQCGARQIDARSDIYSLGCVLYEMIAGRTPFVSGSIFEMIHHHVQTMPASVSTHRRGLPNSVAFDALLLKMLAKDPKDRFQSAAQLKIAIGALQLSLETKLTFARRVRAHWNVLTARRTPIKVLVASSLCILTCAAIAAVVCSTQRRAGDQSRQTADRTERLIFEKERLQGEQFAAGSDWKNAAAAYENALQAGRDLGSENPDVQACMQGLANSFTQLNKKTEAERVLTTLHQAQQFDLDRFNAADDSSEISRLTMEHSTKPDDIEAKHKLLAKLSAQARNYNMLKQDKDALNCADTILSLTSADDPADFSYRVAAFYVKARAQSDSMKFAEADKSLMAMSDAIRRFGKRHAASFEQAELYQALARFFTLKQVTNVENFSRERRVVFMTTAREYYTKAEAQYRQLYGNTSPYLADALCEEGFCLRAAADYAESDSLAEAAIAMSTAYRGTADPRSGRQYLALAHTKVCLAMAEKVSPAEKQKLVQASKQLLDRAEAAMDGQVTQASDYEMALAELRGLTLELANDQAGAETNYLRALDLGLKSGQEHDEAKLAYTRLIRMYQQQKRPNDIKALMFRVDPTGNAGKRIVTDS